MSADLGWIEFEENRLPVTDAELTLRPAYSDSDRRIRGRFEVTVVASPGKNVFPRFEMMDAEFFGLKRPDQLDGQNLAVDFDSGDDRSFIDRIAGRKIWIRPGSLSGRGRITRGNDYYEYDDLQALTLSFKKLSDELWNVQFDASSLERHVFGEIRCLLTVED